MNLFRRPQPTAERRDAPSGWFVAGTLTLFALVGSFSVRQSEGVDATRWMNIYDVSDFQDGPAVREYLSNLRLPIPVGLSLLEILSFNSLGNTDLVSKWGYRFCLVASFLLALWLARGSTLRLLISTATGLIFLAATVLVHAGNPQNYDVYFPFCLMAFFACLAFAGSRRATEGGLLLLACGAAGFFLTMAELLRPFAILVLPIMLAGGLWIIRTRSRRFRIALLLPVLALSGGWHAFIAVRHGQLLWSNHSGFNLERVWRSERPSLLLEDADNKAAPDRWTNLNTVEHGENSKRLRRAVVQYAIDHPVYALQNVSRSLFRLVRAETRIYDHRPEHWLLSLYRPLVWITALWFFLNLVRLTWWTIGPHRTTTLGQVDTLLIVVTSACFFFAALGETAEEARMLISLLPLMAAWPSIRSEEVPAEAVPSHPESS